LDDPVVVVAGSARSVQSTKKMRTSTKFAIVDTVFNYFLFTPLVLLFWYGTYALIDAIILSQFESRLIGTILTLVVGFYIEFTITYWQVWTT